jgi:hydroxyacylglutathione hydrolase
MRIHHFVEPGLGKSAYLVISERDHTGLLVDPLRDVDQYLKVARQEAVRITHVCETHLHNDFLSGSRELAATTGARIVASADAALEFDHQPVRDGDVLVLGEVQVRVLATPGHTPEHVSYIAQDTSQPADPPVLFSGGSLLVGAVSRTDLLGHEHATGLAHQLYRSLHERILPLGDDVVVYPTHGAGSARQRPAPRVKRRLDGSDAQTCCCSSQGPTPLPNGFSPASQAIRPISIRCAR